MLSLCTYDTNLCTRCKIWLPFSELYTCVWFVFCPCAVQQILKEKFKLCASWTVFTPAMLAFLWLAFLIKTVFKALPEVHLKIDIQMLVSKGRWSVIKTFVFMTVSCQSQPKQRHPTSFLLLFGVKASMVHFTPLNCQEYE